MSTEAFGYFGVRAQRHVVLGDKFHLAFDFAQDFVTHGFGRAGHAATAAVGAFFAKQLCERFTGAFARHFDEAELGYVGHFYMTSIALEGFLERILDLFLVLVVLHIDEVDDDQASDAAQFKLVGDFFGGLDIGAGDGFFEGGSSDEFPRVNIDGCQRFGLFDDEVPTAG